MMRLLICLALFGFTLGDIIFRNPQAKGKVAYFGDEEDDKSVYLGKLDPITGLRGFAAEKQRNLGTFTCELYVSPSFHPSYAGNVTGFADHARLAGDFNDWEPFEAGVTVNQTCYDDVSQCLAIYQQVDGDEAFEPIMKGCAKMSFCMPECIATRTDRRFGPALPPTRLCCCTEPMCNRNYSYRPDLEDEYTRNATMGMGIGGWPGGDHSLASLVPPGDSSLIADITSSQRNEAVVVYALSGVAAIIVIFVIAGIVYSRIRKKHSRKGSASSGLDTKGSASTEFSDGVNAADELNAAVVARIKTFLDGLKARNTIRPTEVSLLEVVSVGRYSTVWRAQIPSQRRDVAVKAFKLRFKEISVTTLCKGKAENERCFVSEMQVYSFASIRQHCRIAPFIDALENAAIPNDLGMEYWLVTSWMHHGTLLAYLKAHDLSWQEMCNLAESVAEGVEFLHSELTLDGETKPPIAHRDLNSKNVLVKPDKTACISDFGFAMLLNESALRPVNPMDELTLQEVGTRRYMAPEVLDGAVNLSDPENSLKQADVYGLGLILWEIITRCRDLHSLVGEPTPAHMPPYFDHFATTVDIQSIKDVVCKQSVRPRLPKALLANPTWPALRQLGQLVEDCWDSEAEARISAVRARDRLMGIRELMACHVLESNAMIRQAQQGGAVAEPGAEQDLATVAGDFSESFGPKQLLRLDGSAGTTVTSGLGQSISSGSSGGHKFNFGGASSGGYSSLQPSGGGHGLSPGSASAGPFDGLLPSPAPTAMLMDNNGLGGDRASACHVGVLQPNGCHLTGVEVEPSRPLGNQDPLVSEPLLGRQGQTIFDLPNVMPPLHGNGDGSTFISGLTEPTLTSAPPQSATSTLSTNKQQGGLARRFQRLISNGGTGGSGSNGNKQQKQEQLNGGVVVDC